MLYVCWLRYSVILLTLILSGCGLDPSSCLTCSETPDDETPTSPTLYLYTASNNASGEISSIRLDSSTGAPVEHSVLTSNTSVNLLDVTANGKFLVTANISANTISAYSVGTDGTLTFIEDASTGITAPRAVTIDPSGRFVYVDNYLASGTIAQYALNSTTGALTHLGTIAAGNRPRGAMAFSPLGDFAYVASFFSGQIYQYAVNTTTGALSANTSGTSVSAGSGPVWTALDSTGQWMYVADQYQGITAMAVNASNHTLSSSVPGSPYTCGTDNANAVAVEPNNRFVYGADFGGGIICAYVMNATNGSLSTGSSVTPGCPVAQLAFDPDGNYLYASCYGTDPNLHVYEINQTTGALTAISGSPFATGATNLNTLVVRPAPSN